MSKLPVDPYNRTYIVEAPLDNPDRAPLGGTGKDFVVTLSDNVETPGADLMFLSRSGKWVPFTTTDLVTWGAITGDITEQADLMAMFAQYTPTTGYHSVAFSGNYNELNHLPPLGTVSPLDLDGSTSRFLRGDGTWAIPVDVNAQWGNISGNINAQTDLIALLNLKAPITSPVFQGNPQAPTPPKDDNSKSLATTEWFFGQAFNGVPQMDGVGSSGNSTLWARGNHRHPSDDTKIGDAPTDGQQYARQSQTWTVVAPPKGGGTVTESPTAPANPTEGDIWIQTQAPAAVPPDEAHIEVLFNPFTTDSLADWTNSYAAGFAFAPYPGNTAMPIIDPVNGLYLDGTLGNGGLCHLNGPFDTAFPTQVTIYATYLCQTKGYNNGFYSVIDDGGDNWTSYGGQAYPNLMLSARLDGYRSGMPQDDALFHTIAYTINATNFQLNVDANAGPVVSSPGYVSNRLGYWGIGNSANGAGLDKPMKGYLRAILVYNATHDAATQTLVRNWIAANAVPPALRAGTPTPIASFVWDGTQWLPLSYGVPEAPNDGKQYARQSQAWTPVSGGGGGGSSVWIGDTAPTDTTTYPLWWSSTSLQLSIWYNDGNSSQWVDTNGAPSSPPGAWLLQDGTVTAPGLAWANEPGLGLYRKSTSVIGVAAQGSEAVELDASGAGTYITAYTKSNAGAQLRLFNNAPGAASFNYLNLYLNPDGKSGLVTNAIGGAARGTFGLDAAQILFNDGNVAAPSVSFASESGLGWYRKGTSQIGMAAKGVAVGLLNASTVNTDFQLYPSVAGGGSYITMTNAPISSANFNSLQILNVPTGYNIAEALVGTATAKQLNLNFPAGITIPGAVATGTLHSTTVNGTSGYQIQAGAWTAPGGSVFNFWWSGALQAWIDSTNVGNVSLVSDERIKRNIRPLDLHESEFMAIQPIEYEFDNVRIWTADGVNRWGFSAQNLVQAIPDSAAVTSEETPMPESAEEAWSPLNVDDRPILALTVRQVQDLITRVRALEAKP